MLTKKRHLWYSSFNMSNFFFQILYILELQKNAGTYKVSFVLFKSFNIESFRSAPQIGFLNRSHTNPDGSRYFPDFREDNTLLSSLIDQGGVAILLAGFSRTSNSWSCNFSISCNSGIRGLDLNLYWYSLS